jgi:hypothetical protein
MTGKRTQYGIMKKGTGMPEKHNFQAKKESALDATKLF